MGIEDLRHSQLTRRRLILGGLAGVGTTLALAACADGKTATAGASTKATPKYKMKADGDVTWYTWEQYVDPTIISSFEQKYGVKVTQQYFDSDDTMVQKLAAGLPYDLVTNNSAYIQRTVAAGLVQPIDFGALDTSDMIPYFLKPFYDAGSARYSIPYGGGGTGYMYKKSEVSHAQDWSIFWDSPKADGKITVLTQPEETIGMALLSLGYDLNTKSVSEITKATDHLMALKPQLASVSANTTDDIPNGTAVLAHTWTGTAYQTLKLLKDPSDWTYTMPTGQTPMGMDCLTIGAKAKSPGSAALLMDWLLKPENAAKNAVYTGYETGTKAGSTAIDTLTKDYPFLQTKEDAWADAAWKVAPTGARLQALTQQWNRFTA